MRMDRYKNEYEEQQKKRVSKRRVLLIVIFVSIVIIAAEVATLLTMTSIDRSFPRSVEYALYEGWDLPVNELQLQTTGRITDTAFIDIEMEAVSRYANKNYKDDELSRLASEYISAIKACQQAASQYDPATEPDAFWNAFSEPYGRRLKVLYKMHNGDFHFTPDKKQYADESAYILAQGWLLNATDNLSFKRTDEGNVSHYDAELKNESGLGIEYLDLEVELLDASGKVKETSSVYITDADIDENMHLRFIGTSDKVTEYRIVSETCKFKEREEETDEA